MVGVVIRAFGGISPKTPPRRLSETQAQTADKCAVFNGALRPAKDVSGTTVATKLFIDPNHLQVWTKISLPAKLAAGWRSILT